MSEKSAGEQYTLKVLKNELKAAIQQSGQSRIPLFIAALAALLSIISLADTEADKAAMSAHIESSNKYAYFQAKSIRMTDAKIAAGLFESLEKPELAEYWQKKADRYNTEKFEIFKKARVEEKTRARALRQGDYFKVGVTLLQISIVLASSSLVFGGGLLFGMSVFLTLFSLVYSVNGYGLFFEIPTSPDAMFYWTAGKFNQMIYGTGLMP